MHPRHNVTNINKIEYLQPRPKGGFMSTPCTTSRRRPPRSFFRIGRDIFTLPFVQTILSCLTRKGLHIHLVNDPGSVLSQDGEFFEGLEISIRQMDLQGPSGEDFA